MSPSGKKIARSLSVFSLAMINLAAMGSIKNWPVTAEYGFASIFYLILAALIFFVPLSLVSAELATGWPKTGGVFVWVKEAFGHRTGFLSIWLLWLENVLWYPTILSFLAATIAFVFNPALTENTGYMLAMILVIFWGSTFANCFGMRASSWISTFGVIFGTFIAGFIIIGLGLTWLIDGQPLQIEMNFASALPNLNSNDQFIFFTGVILSYCGIEMSAIHAREVEKPQKNYPRAILLTAITVISMSLLGVLSIAFVIPQHDINLTSGSLQAFSYFVSAYHMQWLTPLMAAFIAIGALGSITTWIIGPSKGLLAAARSGDLPPFCRKLNSKGVPVNLLILQAVIVSLISFVFLLMPTVSSAYWLINVIVSQLYLVMYILMFAAAIKLRYKKPHIERPYKIPGGHVGMWIVAGLGMLVSFATLMVGFLPPSQIPAGNTFFYVSFLAVGVVLSCLAPGLILLFKKENWNHPLPHEREEIR
ncbi:MAG: amino acid permease [Chlamydiae bacterium]|nr:amino acid permease [Chlamydiota bacterium]